MQYRVFFLSGLGIALFVAAIISPFASPDPDGLNRVAEDLEFTEKEHPEPPVQKLPFAKVFEGYALRGVSEQIATPVAGIIGTLATFGLTWILGKLFVQRKSNASIPENET